MFTHQLVIQSPQSTTRVRVGSGLIAGLANEVREGLAAEVAPKIVLVTDSTVGGLYGDSAFDSVRRVGLKPLRFDIDPGEASKSLENAGRLYRFLAENKVGRDALIGALGGGVVSDLAGFAAATWMRGIRWVVCPTTLEAQIDAAIGGKTAVNIPGAKNLVGAFHHPVLVLIDPECLSTLPDRDFRAGLAESVKHAAVFSAEFFEWHERHAAGILARDSAIVQELIERNVRIKAGVVERDPHEQTGERMLLNFGHTIGHAIEQAAGFELRHGECVSLGMIAAANHSRAMGLMPQSQVGRLKALLDRLGLPTRLQRPLDEDAIVEAIHRDKKNRAGSVRFVLLEDFGRAVVRSDVSEGLIRRCYDGLR